MIDSKKEGGYYTFEKHFNDALQNKNDEFENHVVKKNSSFDLDFVSIMDNQINDTIERRGLALDVGCGNGRLTDTLSNLGWRAKGIDFSESGIALAKNDFPNSTFELADMFNYCKDFKESEKYNIIIFRASLPNQINIHLLADLIKDYMSILAENGILIIIAASNSRKIKRINLNELSKILKISNYKVVGPYFGYVFDKLNFLPKNKIILILISKITSILNYIFSLQFHRTLVVKK